MRGVAENDVVLLLVDEIMVDGFVTQGEALLVTQPADLLTEVEASNFSKHVESRFYVQSFLGM